MVAELIHSINAHVNLKLQMAAVVIVRTVLIICKLNINLFSDFSIELLL